MHKFPALVTFLALACGAPPAATPLEDDISAASGLTAGSVFRLSGAAASSGDLLYLQLGAAGRFAWTRCSAAPCADPLREDGTWQVARGGSGHRSLRFFQPGRAGDPSLHFHSAYGFTVSRDGSKLWLRPETGARPFTMEKVAEVDLCAASGGSWKAGACDCGKGWPTAYSPGAGGCWQSPAVPEAACDATQGSWTDDDAGLVGTYCECGIDRRLTAAGCVDVRPRSPENAGAPQGEATTAE